MKLHELQTAAANKVALTRGKHKDRHLKFHFNDSNDVLLARAALLLLVTSECDTSSESNLDFLWALWYHLSLTVEQCSQLSRYISRLAAYLSSSPSSSSSSSSTLRVVSVPDAATLGRIAGVVAKWWDSQAEFLLRAAAEAPDSSLKAAAQNKSTYKRTPGGDHSGRSSQGAKKFVESLSRGDFVRAFTDGAGYLSKAHVGAFQLEIDEPLGAGGDSVFSCQVVQGSHNRPHSKRHC
eukprot:jgi/Mesen1/9939/ME000070S09222